MSESLVLATGLAQGGSSPIGNLAPALVSPGLLTTRLQVTSCYSGSYDDLYVGVSGPALKARINLVSLDAMLDVDPNPVNSILDLPEPLEQVKNELREFAVLIDMKLPPIALRDITWKTVYIAQSVTVGCEPDEFEVYEIDYDDDDETPLSSDVSSNSNGPGAASLIRNLLGSIDSPVSLATADLPLLTNFEGPHGTRERSAIFANEFFEIRRSPTAGWGAFAVKTLTRGDQILVEKALYHATHENVTRSVQELPEKERAIANDMFAHRSRDGETLEEAIWSTNSFVSCLPMKPGAGGGDINRLRPGSQDVAGLFPVAGRFNHSCFPKVHFRFRPEHDALVLTVRDWIIEAGDELTISYGKDPSVLYYKYGFGCECGYCRGFDPVKSEWC
ncbi:hypothetical protein LZ30DRAFT_702377 [Colletotrichum cereale]|nr:hypothetical protein LZ30DRAFT_702377 [Colletotrichum cereale]